MPMPNKSLSIGLEAFCRAYHADSPESAMREACFSLLTSCGLGDPPVPLKPLLQKLGIELRRISARRMKGGSRLDARLAAKRGGLVAYVYEDERDRNWRRARFSLAHE